MNTKTITLLRTASTPWGILGELTMPDGQSWPTLELPWLYNRPNVSAIPAGLYRLSRTYSPLLSRILGKQNQTGFFLRYTDPRSAILIHPGNTIDDTAGCILLGKSTRSGLRGFFLEKSLQAYGEFFELARVIPFLRLDVRWATQTDFEPPAP